MADGQLANGWAFALDENGGGTLDTGSTGANGTGKVELTFALGPTDNPVSVDLTETLASGFDFLDATCDIETQDISSATNPGLTFTIGWTDVVECTFTNRTTPNPLMSLAKTVTDVDGAGAGGVVR